MAYENLCMYCFEDLNGQTTCPHCGRDNQAAVPQVQMLPGSLVYKDRFLVGRALGQDATGIVYAAYDTKKGNKLRIREYLPRDCAERLNDGAVVPVAGLEDQYEAGMRKLRASVQDGEDARKHFFFEQNGTAYIVQRPGNGNAGFDDSERRRRLEEEEEAEDRRSRNIIIALVAGIVVVAVAVVLILMFNGTFSGNRDITETPTMAPDQLWLPSESPTVTPYASPTFAALVDPDLSWMDYDYEPPVGTDAPAGAQTARPAAATATPKPTPRPTLSGDDSGYKNINERSSTSEVRSLQQKLVTLGWLDHTKITGSYDSATRKAVRDFQRYINENYDPATPLTVDGIAGPKTQQWLDQTQASRPTPTPSAAPTRRPRRTAGPDNDIVVDSHSSARKIRAMQQQLILLGVMPEDSDSGEYDAATRKAVQKFQKRVNQLQGYEVLDETGSMDALSMEFLDYYADEWRAIQARATATPSPTPTAKVTPTPTVGFDDGTVSARSSRDAILEVQRRLAAIGLLPEGAADGVYGSATQQAVAAFQQWVNQRRGEETLPMNGEADSLTRAYLKYCQDNNLRPSVEVTQAPTPTPEAAGEQEDFTIDQKSDSASIRRVQELLADVGLIDPKGIDGVYGSGTSRAVAAFQQYVNDHGGSLPVSGVVDDATRRTLEYYSDRGLTTRDEPPVTEVPPTEVPPTEVPPTVIPATAVPEAEVPETPAPATEPPATEVPAAEVPETGEVESIPESWTPEPDVGGLPEPEGDAPGEVEPEGETVESPEVPGEEPVGETPTPEPSVSPVPSVSPLPGAAGEGVSQPESGDMVQNMLSSVGALTEDSATGTYDGDVTQAVAAFQQWVNEQGGAALQVTGIVDDETRRMLEYCVERRIRMGEGTLEPAGPADPDDPFNEPDEEEAPAGTTAQTEGRLKITINGRAAEGEPVEVGDKNFTVKWSATGRMKSYTVYVFNAAGDVIISEEGRRETSFRVSVKQMVPGEVYTVSIGALPRGGTADDMVWKQAQFIRPVKATPEPTETPAPTDTPEPAPEVGQVEAPRIEFTGGEDQGGVTVIEADRFQIAWSAGGSVQSYEVQITDPDGQVINAQSGVTQTDLTIRTGNMQPGVVYTFAVGAVPENGTAQDAAWSQARFMRPEMVTPEPTFIPTPVPTEAPTPEPTATPEPTPAPVGRPAVTVGGAGYQQDGIQYMTDNTIIVSWGAEGEVDRYIVEVENQSGERIRLGETTDTSRTVSGSSLPAGLYTVYVGAVPAYGVREDAQWGEARFAIPAAAPEATAEPEVEAPPEAEGEPMQAEAQSVPIDAETDPAVIQRLQLRLYALGVLTGEPEQGVLDQVTLAAVAEFQQRANEQYGAGLSVIDPSNPGAVIDVDTLSWIQKGL